MRPHPVLIPLLRGGSWRLWDTLLVGEPPSSSPTDSPLWFTVTTSWFWPMARWQSLELMLNYWQEKTQLTEVDMGEDSKIQ